jgi:hypothetical protein
MAVHQAAKVFLLARGAKRLMILLELDGNTPTNSCQGWSSG